jgi:hypothetical protein
MSLERLLKSIQKADYGNRQDIPLIISIDNSGNEDCLSVAQSFQWDNGTKEIIHHPKRLGLKDHVLFCGDLSTKFNGAIVLEDDLFVSPYFYHYAIEAYHFFQSDRNIAGISIYSYRYNEFSGLPFEAINDGFDNYFMQVPCSWGQFWTKDQWVEFREFIETIESAILPSDLLPEQVINNWPENSWKRLFYKFMVAKNKYLVYPRESLVTNMGESGANYLETTNLTQVPILVGKKNYSFSSLENSLSVYDYYYELTPKVVKHFLPELNEYDFECDLHGQKRLNKLRNQYLISIKETTNPERAFGNQLFPGELNVILNKAGSFYSFASTTNFSEESYSKRIEKAMGEVKCASYYIEHPGMVKGIDLMRKSIPYNIGSLVVSPFKYLKKIFNLIE